jgi:EmrB/QacA subfamily drug resistance transporter
MYEKETRTPWVLAAVSLVQFLVSLDLSVVNVALPRIDAALGFSTVGLTWVIHAYALTFGGLLLLGGKAADRFGRKTVLVAGLVIFGLASLAGGFAQQADQLIAARAVQGVGAALLAPSSLAVLTATFPSGRARVRAFGIWGAMNAAGGAVGVLAGGLLTQYADWRWVMFANVPMVAITLLLVSREVRRSDPEAARGLPDIAGGLLATAGAGLLVLGIVGSDRIGWATLQTWATIAAGLLLLAGFAWVEARWAREPLLRLGLLADRSVSGSNLYNLLIGAAMASAFYFVSLYLQDVLGHGPARAGLEFVPFALGVVVGSMLAVRLGYRSGPRTLLVLGALLTAVGFGWFGRLQPDGTFLVDVLPPSLLASTGFGISLATVVRTATAGIAARESGVASGLLNSSRQLGATIGLAALSAAAARRSGAHPSSAELAAGYGWGLTLSAVLLVGAAAIALIFVPNSSAALKSPSTSPDSTNSDSTNPDSTEPIDLILEEEQ